VSTGAAGSLAAKLAAASGAAPVWYAAAVLGLGAFAAVALVGVEAGAGLAAIGLALCGLGAALGPPRRRRAASARAASAGRPAAATEPRAEAAYRLVLWLLAAALALMPAVRAAGWVWIPCLLGAAMLASLAASGGESGRQVLAGLARALRPLVGTAATLAPLGRAAGRADGSRVRPALRGGLIAAALLAVFVPLFTAADAAFAEIVDRALPSGVDVDAPVGRVVALAAVAALGGALAAARASGPAATGAPCRARLARAEWLLPLASLVALFAVFVTIQIAVLFGGHDHVLRTARLTYADYAHQGYGQLMAASMLTLAVIAGARRWARLQGRRDDVLLRGLLAALCALCLVVLASALKRLGLYEEAYGSTRLRMLADANILWLGAVLALVLATLASGRAGWLPRALVLVSAAGTVAFAASNPEGRIASINVDRALAGHELDRSYLLDLSADAALPLTRLPEPECALRRLADDLREPDGPLGANVARARARDAIARLPEPDPLCTAY
jgi:uncharacterized protein DUF4153